MPFMEPEVQRGTGLEVETSEGVWYVPPFIVAIHGSALRLADRSEAAGIIGQYVDGDVQGWRRRRGYFARLTAPGYLDSTAWEFFETSAEVEEWQAVQETGDDEHDEDEEYEDEDE